MQSIKNKLYCLIKFVPDEHKKLKLNPDDEAAVAYALTLKKEQGYEIELVTMAHTKIKPLGENLLRLGIDQLTILSDAHFAGADTFATTQVLATYLQDKKYSLILMGSHSIDGGTAKVPPAMAQRLGLEQLSYVTDADLFEDEGYAHVMVEEEGAARVYELALPAILAFTKNKKHKLPFVSYDQLDADVSAQIGIKSAADLGLKPDLVGLLGSKTKVISAQEVITTAEKSQVKLNVDDDGVKYIYTFLKERGYIE